ncbi:MAG: glucose-6-phosphate dehydrogenase, partial [Actinomycetota bacterium]|nr:glucose-6-phosphate dehydrogenase [Actinomycetota bacterium]
VVAYLALPAAVYPPAVRALRAAGLAAGSRVVLEKPFGEDAASARELDRTLHAAVPERDVFRVDHFLHHQTVQDLLAARLADPLLARVWDRDGVERVDVVWEETAGVSGRADFYDRTGALRDMVQSHLLQLLALVAMHPPARLEERALRDAKAAALRRVPGLTADQVRTRTARGRYTAGVVAGEARRGYLDEDGVDPGRGTETWACARLEVDDPRWAGVPFVLRAGKALGRARKHVEVRLRPVAGALLAAGPSLLRFEMAPDRVALSLPVAGPDGLPAVEPAQLEVARPRQPLPASARMVLDVLRGDPTFTVRDDEAEQCWRITDAVRAGWRNGDVPLQDYAAGSDGPLRPGDAAP